MTGTVEVPNGEKYLAQVWSKYHVVGKYLGQVQSKYQVVGKCARLATEPRLGFLYEVSISSPWGIRTVALIVSGLVVMLTSKTEKLLVL